MSEPQKPHWSERLALGLELLAGLLLLIRHFHPGFLAGQLLPCLALGLAPGSFFTLRGRSAGWAYRLGLAGGLIGFMFANGGLKLEAVGGALRNVRLILAGTLLLASQPLLGAARWRFLLRAREIGFSYAQSLRVVLIGSFFNLFIPGATGGDVFRAYLAARAGGKTGQAVASVVLDRLAGFPALALIVTAGLLLNFSLWSSGGALRPFVGVAVIMGGLCLVGLVTALGGGWIGRKLAAGAESWPALRRWERAWAATHASLSGRGIGPAILISVIAHLANLGAAYIFAQAAGVTGVPGRAYLLLIPLGLAANAVPLSPGGVGQGEGAFYLLFKSVSGLESTGAAAAAMMVCLRLGQLFYALIGGALYAAGHHDIDLARQAAAAATEPPAEDAAK